MANGWHVKAVSSPPKIALSVVIMAYNEEENLPVQVARTTTFLKAHTAQWQIVIVNDGSSDATGAVADQLAAADPTHIDVVHHATNQGMGAAIRNGYQASRCAWITQLPADCQVHPETFGAFIPLTQEADIILSTYEKRDDGWLRKVLSGGFQWTVRLLMGQRGDFTGTMMFRRELFEKVGTLHSNTFFLNLEFPFKVLRLGTPYKVVQIEALPRLSGTSKVRNLQRIRRVLGEIVQLRIRVWRGRD